MRRVVPSPPPNTPVISTALDLGAHIRAARTQSGMTLEEAALSIGISKQTMQNIETNPAKVGLGTVIEAARALGISLFAFQSEYEASIHRVLSAQPWLLNDKAKRLLMTMALKKDKQP